MKLTSKNIKNRESYHLAKPVKLGTLHERMEYVIVLMQTYHEEVPQDLWHAIYDLETEVSFHKPQTPPCGGRTQPSHATETRKRRPR